MLSRISYIIGILLITISNACATSLYFVPMIVYDRLEADDNSFFYGVAPRLAIGYGDWILDEFTFAIEAFVEPLAPISVHNANDNIVYLKPQFTYGAAIMPGILFDFDVKVFALAGVVQTNFKNISTRVGYQVGAGIDVVMNSTWLVRGEYIHTRYKGVSGVGPLSEDQLGIGVVYRFNIC